MCGIAGFVDLGGTAELGGEVLDRMVDAMQRRGPDDRHAMSVLTALPIGTHFSASVLR